MLQVSNAIQVLSELEDVMLRKGEAFRSRAYQRASHVLMKYRDNEIKLTTLQKESGIGETIYTKLCEYQKTGKISALEREKSSPLLVLTNVYGIGPKKAKELIDMGLDTIDKLRQNVNILNEKQQIGLQYYEPLQQKIPRKEILRYQQIFQKILTPYEFEIVGSFRRGAQNSGDIDVILKNAPLEPLMRHLVEQNLITEILSLGKHKCLCITKLGNGPYCRVDFLTTTVEEYPFSLLYFTGSKVFNTLMRGRAVSLGYTMNEHGITTKSKVKLENSFKVEKDIFDFLGIEYREPSRRTDIREYVLNYNYEFNQFKKGDGWSIVQNSKTTVENMISYCEDLYHNGYESPLTDSQYDMLREYYQTTYPNEQINIGADVKKDKIKLPYPMASMDKIKQDSTALPRWMKQYKGPYELSCKLDGVSALFYNEGQVPKLYTRGNGVEGQDISHLIPYLRLPLKDKCTLRGELILSKRLFQEKYNKKAANARNLVSGWVNRKIASPELWRDLSFVAYEMVYPETAPIEQKKRLTKMDVECVKCYQTNGLDNTILSKLLIDLRENYIYEIDGIIVRENKYTIPQTTNPKNAFAFKMILADQVVETKVLEVEWNASKNGYLKPTIKVETCSIGGVTIQRATGFNGKFIQDHGIGPGAVVLLIRSGDVIPHISKVLQSVAPQLPSNPYNWTSTGVDIVLQNASKDSQVIGKQLLAFFQGMEVEGIGPGIISRFVTNGYDTIEKILAMSVEDIKELEGFQEKSAKKVYSSIHQQIKSVSLARLLGKTTIFGRGFGEKRIQSILDEYPDIFVEIDSKSVLLEKISKISGFSSKTAGAFVDNIHRVQSFLDTLHRSYTETSSSGNAIVTQTYSHELSGKKVVFSGVRNKSLVKEMSKYAIQVVDQVTKDTALLIVKDKSDITSKIEKANKYKVPIVTIEEFHL